MTVTTGKMAFVLAGLMVMLLSVSCSTAEGAETATELRSVAELQQPLLELDYTTQLDDCVCTTFSDIEDGTASGSYVPYLNSMYRMQGQYIPDRDFTETELRALGIWQLPGDRQHLLLNILFQLGTYYDTYGQLPDSGVSLFADLSTEEGISAFNALTADEQLSRYFFGINTMTGHFRDTYQATEWSPGAMSIEIIDDPALIAEEFKGAKAFQIADDGEQVSAPAGSIWRVKVFGAERDTLILDYTWCHH